MWPFGSTTNEETEDERTHGLIRVRVTRKTERWHFGPDDDRVVTYDGIDNDIVYRYVDGEIARTHSYNRELTARTETVLVTGDKEIAWREPIDSRTMYLVTLGSADGQDLWYGDEAPILVVTEKTFKQLMETYDVATKWANVSARPRSL